MDLYGLLALQLHKQAAISQTRVCVECNRAFDLTKDTDAQEWVYGHDCEEN